MHYPNYRPVWCVAILYFLAFVFIHDVMDSIRLIALAVCGDLSISNLWSANSSRTSKSHSTILLITSMWWTITKRQIKLRQKNIPYQSTSQLKIAIINQLIILPFINLSSLYASRFRFHPVVPSVKSFFSAFRLFIGTLKECDTHWQITVPISINFSDGGYHRSTNNMTVEHVLRFFFLYLFISRR